MPKLTASQKNKLKKQRQAKKILWKKGILRWKLHDLQKAIYDTFWEGDDDKLTMLIARQTGKSFVLSAIATEICLRKKNAVVKFVTPKRQMVKNILNKNMRVLLEDCPPELKPEWKENDKVWQFPNGSQIQAAGTDNQHYNSIRGGTCDFWAVDEAGFCSDLEEVVYSVLMPTATLTGGRGIISSTPDPKDPEHEFVSHFVDQALSEGRLHKYTLDDNPMLTAEEKERIVKRYPGGRKNTKFRAEYMCEIIRDAESMVVPEFDDEAENELVRDEKRPPFYDYYLSMDIGGKDFTVILMAYYDFLNDAVVVEDEIVLRDKQNSQQIANLIKNTIRDSFNEKPPYLMFADNNNVILLNDLSQYHGLNFLTTKKDNKEAQINRVRMMIQNRKIVINPRCKTLIHHLKTAQWAKKGSKGYREFARSSDNGHYDAVDALIYLVRNVVYGKNPYPSGYGMVRESEGYSRKSEEGGYKSIINMFKIRKSLKTK